VDVIEKQLAKTRSLTSTIAINIRFAELGDQTVAEPYWFGRGIEFLWLHQSHPNQKWSSFSTFYWFGLSPVMYL
jgi:hypothetical protein